MSGRLPLDVAGGPRHARHPPQGADRADAEELRAHPDFVSIGLWEFSTKLNGALHYREILPIRQVGTTVRNLRQRDALYNPREPVSVVIGAYGPDIEAGPLKKIVAVTHGGVYVSKDADQTQPIFQDLLVKMVCEGADCPVN